MQSILDIPLEQFSEAQIHNIGHLAPQVFEPLLRPFRTQRMERRFDMRQTIKGTLKSGSLLPKYSNKAIPTRSARLVIAMSLSGIDRCYAVALIPLLLKLRQLLDFDIYIYTTDIVKAEISKEGFTNDYLLDWNHVCAPQVFSKLAKAVSSYKGEAPELLIIDSVGGKGSNWFRHWGTTEQMGSYLEYNESVGPQSLATLRSTLQGNYKQWEDLSSDHAREWIRKRIKKNHSRFVECPALRPYLLRWLLHPNKRKRTHEEKLPSVLNSHLIDQSLTALRAKCSAVHWLQPHDSYSSSFAMLKSQRQIDYAHKAATLRDFSRVLTNICHHKCTRRISKPSVKVGHFQAATESFAAEEGDMNTQEWIRMPTRSRQASPPYPTLPATAVTQRYKGKGGIAKERQVPYVKLQPIWDHYGEGSFTIALHHLMNDYLQNIPLDEAGDPNISNGSRIELFHQLRRRIISRPIQFMSTRKQASPAWHYGTEPPFTPRKNFPALRNLYTSDVLQTPVLFKDTQEIFEDALQWVNPIYDDNFKALPLYQLAWQTRGDFSPDHLSITFSPEQAATPTIYHELGHYIEHISPEAACCSFQFLKERLGEDSIQKSMYGGEVALINEYRPWIHDYMGKVYKPAHHQLPPRTELLSMGFEYFRDPISLCKLIAADRDLFNLMVFVLSGGAKNSLASFLEFQEKRSFRPPNQPRSSSRGFISRKSKQTNQGFGL